MNLSPSAGKVGVRPHRYIAIERALRLLQEAAPGDGLQLDLQSENDFEMLGEEVCRFADVLGQIVELTRRVGVGEAHPVARQRIDLRRGDL